MKQNEKFLVYAVTGFLVVILGVAVLFGKETPRQLPDEASIVTAAVTPPSLEDVLNRRAQQQAQAAADKGATPAAGGSAESATPATTPDAPAVTPEPAKSQPSPLDQPPLAANVQLLPPTPAALVTEKLGLSRRENGFRLVRARAGDSLGALVQKWCGSTAEYLDQARGLNEELTTLRVGQEIVLPWVDDEVLLAAFERSVAPRTNAAPPAASEGGPVPAVGSGEGAQPVAASLGSALLQRPEPMTARDTRAQPPASPAVVPATAGAARKHKVKTGESLWKIAEREVGSKQAAKFIAQVRELNPGVDIDRIRVGQELVLPQKP